MCLRSLLRMSLKWTLLAEALAVSPLEIRARNILKIGVNYRYQTDAYGECWNRSRALRL